MWLRASHLSFPRGSVMSHLNMWHQHLVATKNKVSREGKVDINCLGTKLAYKCTTNRQQRNGPSQNGHIQKVSSRWPWDTEESSESKCRQLLTWALEGCA